MLPHFLQRLAVWLPPYHLGRLALRTLGLAQGGSGWTDAAALAATTVVSLALAAVLMRRDDGKTYG